MVDSLVTLLRWVTSEMPPQLMCRTLVSQLVALFWEAMQPLRSRGLAGNRSLGGVLEGYRAQILSLSFLCLPNLL